MLASNIDDDDKNVNHYTEVLFLPSSVDNQPNF